MEFCSGKPDNPAASVMDYCTGVLKDVYLPRRTYFFFPLLVQGSWGEEACQPCFQKDSHSILFHAFLISDIFPFLRLQFGSPEFFRFYHPKLVYLDLELVVELVALVWVHYRYQAQVLLLIRNNLRLLF